jgi:ribosome recycling factor
MPQSIKKSADERMDKAIGAFRRDLATLRAGKASPALFDNTPDSRTLMIQPWDKSSVSAIEKAILKSDLGLTPSNDGSAIRISVPPLTEERRADLVKTAKKFAEEAKVAIRNIRRDANDDIKKLEKSDISEDESRRHQEDIQKATDKFIAEVEKVLSAKEKEIMEV